jgi:conjugal transfer/entry exclusion protein
MLNSWDKLVVVMQEVSNLHEHISNQVYQCKENIKQSTNELEAVNELNYKSIHQESSELQKKVAAMEKLQYAYEKRIKDVDASSAAYNKSLVEYEETKEKFMLMEQMNQNCIGAGTVNPVESAYKKSVKENEYKKAKIEQVFLC